MQYASNDKLNGQAILQSGFLPDYTLLTEVDGTSKDVKMWRYRNASIDPTTYTAIIIDPIATDSGAPYQGDHARNRRPDPGCTADCNL